MVGFRGHNTNLLSRTSFRVTLAFLDNLSSDTLCASWSDSAAARQDLSIRLGIGWLAVFAQLRKYATIAGKVRPNQ